MRSADTSPVRNETASSTEALLTPESILDERRHRLEEFIQHRPLLVIRQSFKGLLQDATAVRVQGDFFDLAEERIEHELGRVGKDDTLYRVSSCAEADL